MLLVFFFACFYCPFTPAKIVLLLTYAHICIFILLFNFHLKTTEARSKGRVLLLVFIVKRDKVLKMHKKKTD